MQIMANECHHQILVFGCLVFKLLKKLCLKVCNLSKMCSTLGYRKNTDMDYLMV